MKALYECKSNMKHVPDFAPFIYFLPIINTGTAAAAPAERFFYFDIILALNSSLYDSIEIVSLE